MCTCNPLIRTPWCGRPGCEAPVAPRYEPPIVLGMTEADRHGATFDPAGAALGLVPFLQRRIEELETMVEAQRKEIAELESEVRDIRAFLVI